MTITIENFLEYCKTNLKIAPSIIFEIGAREASDSIKFKTLYPDAEVYAFEAYPEEYNIHCGKQELKGIKYFNIGMWNEEKTLAFYKKGVGTGISSFRDRGVEYGGEVEILTATTVSSFCNKNNISTIDIVKIDVEGCTYEVLQGFGELLSTIKIMHIETEQDPHFKNQKVEKEVFSLLKEKGFINKVHSYCCLSQYDSIWIRKEI